MAQAERASKKRLRTVRDGLTVRPEGLIQVELPARRFGLEGIIAKRIKSRYEVGRVSGAWVKCRVRPGQEFVVGGY